MNEQLEIFVNQRLPLPGLLGWGASLPDRSVACNGYHDGFRPNQMEEFLRRIVDLASKLSPDSAQVVHYCWTFQLVRIYSVVCPQGASMMLFLRNDDKQPLEAAMKVLAEFEKLKWELPTPVPASSEAVPA